MMRRFISVWVALCVAFVAVYAPVVAAQTTYQTVKVNGAFLVPKAATAWQAVSITANTVRAASPWVATAIVGYELVKLFVPPVSDVTYDVIPSGLQSAFYGTAPGEDLWSATKTFATAATCSTDPPSHTIAFSHSGATKADVCAAFASSATSVGCATYSWYSDVSSGTCLLRDSDPSGSDGSSAVLEVIITLSHSCPSGYTWNAQTALCQGSQPTAPTYKAVAPTDTSPGGWQQINPEVTPGAAHPASPMKIEISPGVDADLEITPTPGGGFKLETRAPDPKPTGEAQTTIQNITINNAGNVVSSSITTVGGTVVSGGGQPIVFPDDYNREVTQKEIKDELKGAGAPPLPPQGPVVDAAKADSDAQIGQISQGIKDGYADKSSWFSWVWTPPIGTCAPFAGTVHGYTISWDLCPTIADINDVLGWLFAIFGAWSVYREMFGRA